METMMSESKYLVIELDEAMQACMDELLSAGLGKSNQAVVTKALEYAKTRLGLKLTQELPKEAIHQCLEKSPDIKLSRRQKQLIPLLDRGLTNGEIAQVMDLSEHTVKVHLWRFFRKLKVHNRTQALYFARSIGWI